MPHATTQINSLISLRRGKEECQMPASLVTTQAKRPKTLRRGKDRKTDRVTEQKDRDTEQKTETQSRRQRHRAEKKDSLKRDCPFILYEIRIRAPMRGLKRRGWLHQTP